MNTVWSFDLGKASIGEAVRDTQTNNFLHKASLLIPAEFASTKSARDRRRMYRTRLAHKAREAWLDEVWRNASIPEMPEPLRKRTVEKVDANGRPVPSNKKGAWRLKHPADERLEREFAPKGDPTCYTSCLLRIKLLRGERLEPWQIYKALHSAIQRRGYDPNIPWKARETRRRSSKESEKEEEGTRARMTAFQEELKRLFPDREDCQLPCYFDAVKMHLCDPAQPDVLRERIDCSAESTRNQVIPRYLVEKEIRLLVEQAGKQIPGLAGKAEYLLWGPARKPYASHDIATRKRFGLREGGASDWQGVVGQKIPRFDNRIIDKCALIPRLNVCKIKSDRKGPLPESQIVFEATFLMKLKNMQVQRGTEQTGLTAEEIKAIFDDPKRKDFKITESQWRKYCTKFGVIPLPGYEDVAAPRTGGRSRFCRPALELLKRLILSGTNPPDFLREEIARLNGNTNPVKGLVPSDLKFIGEMGATWEKIHIPNQKLDAILQRAKDADAAVREIIGSQSDPIVRHRLSLFYERLQTLREQYGVPEFVVLEFVREDFMGKKAVLEYRAFLKKREAERKRAREDAAQAGATERSAALKLELLREQGGVCLYTGQGLRETDLDQYQIDHIVPRAKGGPDAVINYVLTTRKANDDKGDRTPFEWLSKTDGWDAYVQRVRSCRTGLRNKKMQLLINEDATELAEKYTALAETAWISKLSRAILDAFFGWRNGNDSTGVKRVVVVNGGLTARIRRKYKLNKLLNPDAASEEEAEKKNRSDHRHHALDAMVISFIPGWTRDASKEHFFRLPPGVHRETFAQHINEVTPRNICLERPALAETIYGARNSPEGRVIVQRVPVVKLAYTTRNMKEVFDIRAATENAKVVTDLYIRKRLVEFIATTPDEPSWLAFCDSFNQIRRNGMRGSPIRFVTLKVGSTEPYRDLSKDGTGAWRRALKGHKGQFVYLDQQDRIRVRPVYVFESLAAVREETLSSGVVKRLIGFFEAGCSVILTSAATHTKTTLPPGCYILNGLKTDGRAKLTSANGTAVADFPIAKLLTAGFHRAD